MTGLTCPALASISLAEAADSAAFFLASARSFFFTSASSVVRARLAFWDSAAEASAFASSR